MKQSVYFLLLTTLAISTALPPTVNWDRIRPHGLPVKNLKSIAARDASPGSRIIGGDEVEPNSVPYQAALLLNGVTLCGGSLISTKTVLTAAHCTIEASFVIVVLGAHALNRSETTQIRLTSSNIVNHEGYTVYLENDVALVRLPSPVILNDVIKAIPLAPPTAASFEGSSAYLTGWGMTSDQQGTSNVLRGVNLSVISNTECAARFILIRPSNICTSGIGVVGACHSDSGGPLVVDGVQVGIVSFGSGSCVDESPTGFTRVSYFRDWIEANEED